MAAELRRKAENMRRRAEGSEYQDGSVQRRGAKATASILRATLELGEELGVDVLTVEKISARTGIAKTTIYRRWPNVSGMIVEAVLSKVTEDAPIVEKSNLRETFSTAMKLLVRLYRGPHGPTFRALIGRAQNDQSLRRAIETHWVEPRRKIAREILRRGMRSGELRSDLDPDVVLDALYGAIYHRFLLPYDKSVLSMEFVDALIAVVFGGIDGAHR